MKRPKPEETDYRFLAEERTEGWRVHATFLTSEYSASHERYVFSIGRAAGMGNMSFSEAVLIRLRNEMY